MRCSFSLMSIRKVLQQGRTRRFRKQGLCARGTVRRRRLPRCQHAGVPRIHVRLPAKPSRREHRPDDNSSPAAAHTRRPAHRAVLLLYIPRLATLREVSEQRARLCHCHGQGVRAEGVPAPVRQGLQELTAPA